MNRKSEVKEEKNVYVLVKTFNNYFQSFLQDQAESYRESKSMSSGLDMLSGRIRGMAATHVLNRSILGFLSPLNEIGYILSTSKLFLTKGWLFWGVWV